MAINETPQRTSFMDAHHFKRLLNLLSLGCVIPLLLTSGCAFLTPMPKGISTEHRLSKFPLKNIPLTGLASIYWDDHQIPFIHAQNDADVPFLIGMVHAHLRLGQMEMMRRVSQGRMAEMFGPFVADFDHAIRIIDYGRAAQGIRDALPSDTRQWLERYAEGINFYVANADETSLELSVLGIQAEPWKIEDIITVGRLSATDVNWLYWFFSLRMHQEPAWPEVWDRLKSYGRASLPSFSSQDGLPVQLLNGSMKSGSNSIVISGRRSASKSGLIANDPHLGLMLPNLWVLVGYKSPSFHTVGLTFPGVPMVLVGRNAHIAWGGTNMLSFSSSLYNISGLNEDNLKKRREHLKVRWWFDRDVEIRESPYGPVLSDAKALKELQTPPLALKWRGHSISDEFSALLRVNRAKTWEEFREAFESYAVSGQNMLYADNQGNIGHVAAVDFPPAAARTGAVLMGDPQNPRHQWQQTYNALQLPAAYNPEEGFLASANNIPVRTDPGISMFGNSNDRVRTMRDEIQARNPLSLEDLKAIQTNVYSHGSFLLAQAIVKSAPPGTKENKALLTSLAGWDGRYTVDSKGAAAFELIAYHFASTYYRDRYGDSIAEFLLRSPAVYTFLRQDLGDGKAGPFLASAIETASEDFKTHSTWGDLHMLQLRHPLGNVPLLGRKYRFGDHPVPGSSNTIMKSAHPLSGTKHSVTYGANARHISDLSDLDENYFVLLGGQDGFWGSDNFLDQFDLWLRKSYVRVPLRLESVQKEFGRHMVLNP
jgi:penicillin amidase